MSKILIVEDDLDIAEVERDYLKLSGYDVDIVENGVTAIEMEKKNGYSLILLDLMLPGLDGFSVCKKLKEDHRQLFAYRNTPSRAQRRFHTCLLFGCECTVHIPWDFR